MSLESKIDALTAAVVANTQAIQALLSNQAPAQQMAATVPQQAPAAPAVDPAMNATPMGMVQAPVTQAQAAPVQMPPAPSFMAPPVQQAAPTAPFTDTKGLIAYMTQAYAQLGPEKGALMQNVLTGLGYQNVNDVQPGHFPAVFQQIEALKG